MRVKTEETFDASHRLEDYDGKCANLHGHRWRVVVWAEGEILEGDMLVDFSLIKDMVEDFDHTTLNEVADFNPTAENLAEYFKNEMLSWFDEFEISATEFKVRVYESPKSYAEVETLGYGKD